MRFNLVCGPPGSGKSSFVNNNFKKGDVVVDLDEMYSCFTKEPLHGYKDSGLLDVIKKTKMNLIENIIRCKSLGDVWCISCLPSGQRRKVVSRQMRNAKIFLLMPSKDQCIKQILNDKREYSDNYAINIVEQWYEKFTANSTDIIVNQTDGA